MEVYAYLTLLLATKKNPKETQKIINNEEHNFALGLINFDDAKKTFYRF